MQIEKIAVTELSFDPSNARKHSEKNIEAIKGSLRKFGQRKPIVVRNGVVIAGNGTLQAALALGWSEIEVVRADDMTNTDAMAFALADNRTSELAEWDSEVLGFQLQALFEDGFEIGEFGFDVGDFNLASDSTGGVSEESSKYTTKIEAPIYEIKGDKPDESQLYDKVRTNELLSRIKSVELPNEVKEFLINAASRHTVFNYQNIAEYYAHAPREVQELMEESALVIIDFSKAIELGFVKLAEEVADSYLEDSSDE